MKDFETLVQPLSNPYLDGFRVCFYASYDSNEHIICVGLQASQVKDHAAHTEAFSSAESFSVWEVSTTYLKHEV